MGSGGGEAITAAAAAFEPPLQPQHQQPAPPPPQQQQQHLVQQAQELQDALDATVELLPLPETMVLASAEDVLTTPHAMMLPVVPSSSAASLTPATTTASSSSVSGASAATGSTPNGAAATANGGGTGKGSKSTKGTSSQTQLGETGRENTGRWTCEEHVLFLKGLEMHGKGWKKIAKLIKTRTVVQIRTHAQKYFQKLAKAKKNGGHHGDLLGMEGSRFGKRVKFTGKRRGLVYGSYLVGVEATSAAISPALKPFMEGEGGGGASGAGDHGAPPGEGAQAQGQGQGQQAALSDKEEDAAIERGLYRFLSPVVMDAQARALDAAGPEVVPPSTPAGGTSGVKAEDGAMDASSSVAGGGVDAGDDASAASGAGAGGAGAGGPVEPLPTLAKVTPELYERAAVPEWFKGGGDIDALLAQAVAVDWLADSGGDAKQVADKGRAVLAKNIAAHSTTSLAFAPSAPGSGSASASAPAAVKQEQQQEQQQQQQQPQAAVAKDTGAAGEMMPVVLPAGPSITVAAPKPTAAAKPKATPTPKRKNGGAGSATNKAVAAANNANGGGDNASVATSATAGTAKSKGSSAPKKPRAPKKPTKKQLAAAAAAEAAAAAAAAAATAAEEDDMPHDFDVAFGHHHHHHHHDGGLDVDMGELKDVHLDPDHHHGHQQQPQQAGGAAQGQGQGQALHAVDGHDHHNDDDMLLDDELSHIVFSGTGGGGGFLDGGLLLDDLDDHGIEF